MYLFYHVTHQDHLIERSCKFMGGTFLCYVATLITLVTMNILT